jgi:uncharacterized membrane protein YpjA
MLLFHSKNIWKLVLTFKIRSNTGGFLTIPKSMIMTLQAFLLFVPDFATADFLLLVQHQA